MYTKSTYIGTLKGVSGVWCGFKPKGIKVEKEVVIYYPDEGKIFKKGDEFFDNVLLQEGEFIEDYQEVEKESESTED